MFKNLKLNSLLGYVLLFPLAACASAQTERMKIEANKEDYLEAFSKFRKSVCRPGVEKEFSEKLKLYRGTGYWIPELNGDVDIETIKSLLPTMDKKLLWIQETKKRAQVGNFPKSEITKKIRQLASELLILKKTELSTDEKEKKKARTKSLELLGELRQQYDYLIKELYFFTNFQFPVDHLKNRKVYDELKDSDHQTTIRKANYAFLYRKILEDGSFEKNHSNSDIYFRTTLDTLYFELKQTDFYLTEDARYDLSFILGKIEAELSKGREKVIERLTEWEERTTKSAQFYRSLTGQENNTEIIVDGKKTTKNKLLVNQHNEATHALRDFVYSKQAEVYDYWLGQSESLKAIYVLETILLNEVGGVDGDDALERMDVARVVMNRLDKSKYLALSEKDYLYSYLSKKVEPSRIAQETWLNALFKQGEFSFTYFYMHASSLIFCPDVSASAKKLRSQNIEIALRSLGDPKPTFKATRYFSRASMIGRIHMETIWEDYLSYPERPGLLSPNQESLKSSFQEGRYHYLYSFKDDLGDLYQVIEIQNKNFSLVEKQGRLIFYDHRNPHYFRYFTKTQNSF